MNRRSLLASAQSFARRRAQDHKRDLPLCGFLIRSSGSHLVLGPSQQRRVDKSVGTFTLSRRFCVTVLFKLTGNVTVGEQIGQTDQISPRELISSCSI